MNRHKWQRFVWIADYKCGCSANFNFKHQTLRYCAVHGMGLQERIGLYKVPFGQAKDALLTGGDDEQ